MLQEQVKTNSETAEKYFNRIIKGQDRIHANMIDQKVVNTENTSCIKHMKLDIAYIKSDKTWLNRLVVGFVFLTALGGLFKYAF